MNTRLIKLLIVTFALGAVVAQYPNLKEFKFNSTVRAVGDLSVDWGVSEGNPIFTVSNLAPGDGPISRSVNVSNGAISNRPVAVRGVETTPSALADKLNLNIYANSVLVYSNTLSQFFQDSNLASTSGIALTNLPPGGNVVYRFDVSFDAGADNDYQNQTEVFDLHIGTFVNIPTACQRIQFSGPPIFGTSRSENITGTPGNDLIVAFEGNDKVEGETVMTASWEVMVTTD